MDARLARDGGVDVTSEAVALLALSVTLLGTLLVSTWRFSSLVASLTATVARLEAKEQAQDARLTLLDRIPLLEADLASLRKNASLVPKMHAEVEVLKAKADFSRELRAVSRASRHDDDKND